jgi:peroxiredoxin Q/BCP
MPAWGLGLATLLVVAMVGVAIANTLSGAGDRPLGYDVGSPGVGETAPDFELPGASGERYRLSARQGQDVLLYFHEGLGCAPCWQQVIDIQRELDRFSGVGVDEVVAISLDPLAAQAQHAQANGVTLPILADEGRSVSQAYDALSYRMMGGATPGHTFVLVGPDGVIRWRADYGGPPNFTMYVPNDMLLAELRAVPDG